MTILTNDDLVTSNTLISGVSKQCSGGLGVLSGDSQLPRAVDQSQVSKVAMLFGLCVMGITGPPHHCCEFP